MTQANSEVSRRRFIGGSIAAAVGGFSVGAFEPKMQAQESVPWPSIPLPLEQLRPTGPLDEAYWWKVKGQCNMMDGQIFMNTGTIAPVPQCILEEHERINRELAMDPSNAWGRAECDVVRKEIGDFVGASGEEIAIVRSTTEALNIFASGLDWKEGDEVLWCTHEHPGGIGGYKALERRRGIKIKTIDIPIPPESVDQVVGLYEKAITPRTRVILLSHMTYVTGTLLPAKEVGEMAHSKGVRISVDGAHPLGMIELDFHDMGCDHYAAAGQKWLMAGGGTAVCYVRSDVQDHVWPLIGHVEPGAKGENISGARKYEQFGQRHVPSAVGLSMAMKLQNTIGKKNIEARIRYLGDRLRRGLNEIPGVKLWTSMDPKLSAGLTLFSVRDIPMANVQKALQDRARIYIRTMTTGGLNGVRASTHIFNMPEEVDLLVETVRYISENASKYMTTTT